jgi:Ca-activated chloride channel family protein
MQGPSIRQARSALLRALDRLRPGDRFNVLAFSDDSVLFGRGLLPASAMTLSEARSWVARLDAGGGTMMHPALLRAATQFLDAGASRPGTVRRIVMITDAAVGNEDQLLREAAGGLGDVRLHIVGIGAAPNRYLVRRLAALGGGLSAFVTDPDESLAVIDDFIARIDRPVLRDLRLEWTGAAPLASHPERLPELFVGELLLWSGRFPAGAKVAGRLTAAGDDGAWSCTLDAPREAVGTAARGGRLAVEELMADLAAGAPLERIRPLVVETALTHGLVTQFTSRVAVEDAPGPGEAARICRLPNGLPAGSRLLDGVSATGTGRPLLALLGGVLVAAGAGGLLLRRRRAVRA